ncbi:MAG: hypothetical protein IPN67_09610 [Bacteroidales bacterium]|nr:hypothetical protein [Bacteroidales bacterium]
MKIALKIFKLAAVLIVACAVILFTASRLMQDKVADIILKSLNQNISTKLHVGTFRLSFLSKFPKASLELRDVLVHSSPNFNSVAFKEINTDTLLAARNVSIEFKITDILLGSYNIERIRAKTGKMNFFTDTDGKVNYDISVKNKKPGSDELTINLEKVYLADIRSCYNNLATRFIIKGVVRKGTLKSIIHGNNIDFSAKGEIETESIQLNSTFINKAITGIVDIDLQKTKKGISFKKGNLQIDNYDFDLEGYISADNLYDLKIKGHNIDISKIRNYLPDKYQDMLSDYNLRGVLVLDSKIKGLMTRKSNPHAEVSFRLDKGSIAYARSDLSISNLSFEGIYSNGSGNRPETGSFTVKSFSANLGSAPYKGSFTLSRLNNPFAELNLKGKLIPGELKEFFHLSNVSTARGSASFDLKLSGEVNLKKKFGYSEIVNLDKEGEISFDSFCIGLNNDSLLVTGVQGNLLISDAITAKNLKFLYREQKISVDGDFTNLLQWLEGRPVQLVVSANVSFSRFIPEAFYAKTYSKGKSAVKKRAFKLPDDLILDINFKVDSLTYKTFSSSRISGTLNYRPKLLTFKSFNMKALKGSISGNGFILQNNNNSVLSKGIFNVTSVDVNKAFTSFQNFGQNFLKAENIAGSLSGTFSVLLPLDSLLNPQIRSLTAEGKAMLVNGALINFDPVKELSSFIELSELENIHFEKMENDFFIRNNYVYIPQMEVRSSAVDLSVNGRHSLDNDYEYHVKVLLSEILSKKRNKNKSNVTEFGEVQDDGLGRTSMLLKVVSKGEDVKVSYDMKAAANGVKNNFKSEKKTLKTILNQEYGWYKDDTAVMQKPAEKKPRFKVTWDDK